MEKMKRKRIKRIILALLLVVFVVALAVLPVIARQNAAADGPKKSILQDFVNAGDITTGIKGGGMLMEQRPERIMIPSVVKLTGFLVSNGDVVSAGDAIAQVDPVTVMAAIADSQQKLEMLARQIETFPTDNSVTKLKARAGAVVKAVYARKGQPVQGVILEHGCLALLSIGGRMAVTVETDTVILAGTAVTVIFEDGVTVSAAVDSCIAGELTVSFEDKNYEIGTSVQIQTGEGELLGSGTLEIRDPLRLMASDGVVKSVAVSSGQWVDANTVLLELTDAGESSEYGSLLAARQEQEKLLQDLIAMHYTGIVTAPCDGVISGIDKNCPALLDAQPEAEEILPDSLNPGLLSQFSQGENGQNTDVFVAAVAPQQWASVIITVDEQDVLRLKTGMEAVVKIPALSEETLTATVTDISPEGKNQGGSSKFSVKLTLPGKEKMLPGMNVTVVIPVETVVNVNRIPVAAVVDLGTKTVVYRGYDEKKETLTNPVEVILGRSDGIYVEVLSGLGAGDVFYYAYYDKLALTDEPDFGVLPFAGH